MVQRYKNIPHSFISYDFSAFLDVSGEQNSIQFTLKHKGEFPFDAAFIADQIAIYDKAKSKLPTFAAAYAIFTPQSYEQSSSEVLANYKASLLSGHNLLDLSGGLGVDDWAFAKHFSTVVSLDIDAELNKVVRSNFEKLGVSNIERLDMDANLFVGNNVDTFDWVFMDADRRVGAKRTYGLSDTEPNILALKNQIFSFSSNILLKISPMFDIHAIIDELKDVQHIWVVSAKNEVKEILVHLNQQASETIIEAVNIDDVSSKTFSKSYNQIQVEPTYANDGLWFYEPALALIKSNLASVYLQQTGISQLAKHSIYGINDVEVKDFFGRKFQLFESFEFSKGRLKTYLNNNHITKANIAKRNFPMEVEEIKKLTGLKDGGEHYLFFSQDETGVKYVFHCGR